MMSLDEEISHLQKENSQVDSQLHRMKSDVGGMETEAASDDKVLGVTTVKTKIKYFHCFKEAAEIKRRNAKLSDYYENLRTNVFSILGRRKNSQ